MYCKKCGMILHPEESVNFGLCENCFDKYLENADKKDDDFKRAGEMLQTAIMP